MPILADDSGGKTIAILAPGAGGHMEHRTLSRLSELVRESGARVVRFNFLYRAQGKSMPDRMPKLMATYRAVMDSVCERFSPSRVIIGGHSMGGRVASMVEAEAATADGLLLFGYPLHPPGQPDKLRDAHLANIKTPTLQLNGTEDDFCTRSIMETVGSPLDPALWRTIWIHRADHSFDVKKSSGRTRQDVECDIRRALADWPVLSP